MKTAEAMATAVLEGDMAAARALADHLLEMYSEGAVDRQPTRKITVPVDRLRVVCFFSPYDAEINVEATRNAIDEWLRDGKHLLLMGCERMDVYEFP